MRRREFIAGIVGSTAAWPLTARAQQSAMPVIGFLSGTSLANVLHLIAAFHRGLKNTGFVEGQNVAIEYRTPQERYDQLPALVADLVRRQVAVIVAFGPPTALAAKAATPTIPIVFVSGGDVVKSGRR
jgi:putative tryptophan/tyrosine transport system substrate-binding protein